MKRILPSQLWVIARTSGSPLYPAFLCRECLSEHVENPRDADKVPAMSYSTWWNYTEGKQEDSFCPLCCRTEGLVNLMRVNWPDLILRKSEVVKLANSLSLMGDDREYRNGTPAPWALDEMRRLAPNCMNMEYDE